MRWDSSASGDGRIGLQHATHLHFELCHIDGLDQVRIDSSADGPRLVLGIASRRSRSRLPQCIPMQAKGMGTRIAALQQSRYLHLMTTTINDTIERALDSAGIDRNTASRRTIRAALAAAGLVPPPGQTEPAPRPSTPDAPSAERGARGRFTKHRHVSRHGARNYWLYVPASTHETHLPLIVMLHGCKQTPEDFARGTRMNELAERHGFLVAYPEQTQRDNGSNCWNWFEPAQQSLGGAEPALVAGIASEIVAALPVARDRVYVAGLSAGAAMAILVGQAHPGTFAGIAAHSGLPAGAAHDVASAFAAMQGRSRIVPAADRALAVPIIVLHGDADSTVVASNASTISAQAVAAFEREGKPLHRLTRLNTKAAGGTCTVSEYSDEEGRVHGGGHAWFGGSPEGTYTDCAGPDASAEIVRFFLQG